MKGKVWQPECHTGPVYRGILYILSKDAKHRPLHGTKRENNLPFPLLFANALKAIKYNRTIKEHLSYQINSNYL